LPLVFIEDFQDSRLEAYRNLRQSNPTFLSGRFVVESRWLVERLLASDHTIESLLVDEDQLETIARLAQPETTVFVLPAKQIPLLIGFKFHRGFLGCGRRKPKKSINDFSAQSLSDAWTGVMLVGLQDPENMGLIARTCAALGIQDIFLSPGCVDPYARRVLRVSMGGMLALNQYHLKDPVAALAHFHEQGVRSLATTLSSNAVSIHSFRRDGPTLILFGNEAEGLPASLQAACQTQITIPMTDGTDSLNVSVAAGIFLHYLTRLSGGQWPSQERVFFGK
jgi:tRNA G18 (ribose-2'-O)-methylase SpoU